MFLKSEVTHRVPSLSLPPGETGILFCVPALCLRGSVCVLNKHWEVSHSTYVLSLGVVTLVTATSTYLPSSKTRELMESSSDCYEERTEEKTRFYVTLRINVISSSCIIITVATVHKHLLFVTSGHMAGRHFPAPLEVRLSRVTYSGQ